MAPKLNKALIGGSIILLVTFNIYNALNFLFQFSMARLLSVLDYGILATLFSIIYILTIFSESIQTIISKYSSTESNKGKLKNIFKKSLNKALIVSSVLFLCYAIISIPLSNLLKINYSLLLLNGLMIFTVFLVPVGRGIMQGQKRFKSLGINLITESSVKLILSIFLVLIGWKVYGAIAATIIGLFSSFILSFAQLKSIIKQKEVKAETSGIYGYTKPVFFMILFLTLFYSLDIIIARIVFSEQISSYYAIAAILGKIVFWGTQPISKAMFPLSAKNSDKKESKNILLNAFGILSLLAFIGLVIVYFFPDLIVSIFTGKSIPESSNILFYVASAMSILSLSNLFILHKLSTGKVRGYGYFSILIAVEVILLLSFSQSLLSYSIALIASSVIFLIGSIFLLR